MLIPYALPRCIGNHKIIPGRLLFQAGNHGIQTELCPDKLFSVPNIIIPCNSLHGIIVVIQYIRRQILLYGLSGIHGHAPAADIHKSHEFKGGGNHIQHSLLFPDRIRDVGPGHADASQAQVYGGNCQVFCKYIALFPDD